MSNKKVLLGLLALVVAGVLIGAYVLKPKTASNPEVSVNDEVTIKSSWNTAAGNSYTYHGITLEAQNAAEKDKVDVYLSDGSNKTLILNNVDTDVPGGSYPQFEKTTDPNLALFTISSGDAGFYFSEYNVIDLQSRKVTRVYFTNGPEVSIITDSRQKYKIELLINNPCTGKSGGQGTLADFTVNGVPAQILKPRSLSCVDPGGIGSFYEPELLIYIVGMSKDMSKLYFNLRTTDFNSTTGASTISGRENYAFIMATKKIVKEVPADLLFENRDIQ